MLRFPLLLTRHHSSLRLCISSSLHLRFSVFRLSTTTTRTPIPTFITNANAARKRSDEPQRRRFSHGRERLTKEQVLQRVLETVKRFDKVDSTKVTPTSTFEDLGLNKLDVVELIVAIEEDFCITLPDQVAETITSIPEACREFGLNPYLF